MSQHARDLEVIPAAPAGDGALLLDIYRRLVPLHATLTEHGPRRPELARIAAADLKAVLGMIETSTAFRAAASEERQARAKTGR